jgi:predicted Zn-dependent protease
LFPNLKTTDKKGIVEFFTEYYKFHGVTPDVSVSEDFVIIRLNFDHIQQLRKDFAVAVEFCEQKQFEKAKNILENLIKKNPNHSEYYRLLGQIESEVGDVDVAIDYLVEALRKDSSNPYALLMMGNIFAKQKKDVEWELY